MKINQRIEVVFSVSSKPDSTAMRILAIIRQSYANVRLTIISDLSDLDALVERKPDLVFLRKKFIITNPALGIEDTNKIWISSYLDKSGIIYTGSSQRGLELELNKHLAKQTVRLAGIKTSPFYIAKKNRPLNESSILLEYPVFIKPINRGGGAGIDGLSVARNFSELVIKVQSITDQLQTDSLIEEYLPGREFSIAVIKNKHSKELLAMPIELAVGPDEKGDSFLSQAVKSADIETISDVTDPVLHKKLTQLAISVFKSLGARDYGRVDVRLDAAGVPNFLEANFMPSLIENYGSFPRACNLNRTMDYETMILRIVELGKSRNSGFKLPSSASYYNVGLPAYEAI